MAAPTFNLDAYTDALVLLGTAAIVVPMVQRWRVSPVLGYLVAGVILGPFGLGSFKWDLPFLQWITVGDAKNVSRIAELGVVFLMFLIGMELSYERLVVMRRLVFGLGGLQVALSTIVIAGIAIQFGNGPRASIIIGSCLALSSTAIVIEVLARQRRLTTAAGRTSFSILLFQDLAVVPILFLVGILGASQEGSLIQGVGLALLQAAIAVALIVVVGRLLLRPLFRLVAATEAAELFVAATLFVIVSTAVLAGVAGLSMTLGAFVAGLLLAETEFRKAVETTIDPFKGLLLGMFFFTVGMGVDLREVAREPAWLLASVVGLIGIKATLIAALARLFRVGIPAAIETALLLGPGGEFAFVVIGLATTLGVVAGTTSRFMLAVTSLSMALIPVMAILARRVGEKLEEPRDLAPEIALPPPEGEKGHAIVIGHGRVGQIVCTMLERHRFPFLAIDRDPAAVAEHRRRGRNVYYGDAASAAFLRSCGVMDAAGVVVTTHDQAGIDEIVQLVRALRPDVLIVARARDSTHAQHLYAIGVTDAVPETIEASLQLSEATLVGLGQPMGPVIASIHELRDEFRHTLSEAADHAGRTETHSIRAKTLRTS